MRAAESRMSARTTAMCLLCQHVRRPGWADRVRTDIPPWLQDRDPADVVAERAAELRVRVRGFVDAVRR